MNKSIDTLIKNILITFFIILVITIVLYSNVNIDYGRTALISLILIGINFIFILISGLPVLFLSIERLRNSFQFSFASFLVLPLLLVIIHLTFIAPKLSETDGLLLLPIPLSSFTFFIMQILSFKNHYKKMK